VARNRVKRLAGFAAGIVLFYAPFALVVRGVGMLAPNSLAGHSVADVHTACLRMPLGWLAQPWMWPTLGTNPISFLPVLVLPLAALAVGPMFCGWLCPAGALPEYLGRAVPDRFKFDFKGRVDIVPLRYGFFIGFLVAPFVSASICCSFCNFTHMQNIVSAAAGNLSGFAYFSSLGVLAAAVWIVPLGMLTRGGRGWCLFLCPAGTAMGLASAVSARAPWARRVREGRGACSSCGSCEDVCPMRAVSVSGFDGAEPEEDGGRVVAPQIDHHLCNECLDCVAGCPNQALEYRRSR
jgi:ferredoxin-type protein NapH